jgi:phenylacetic acid degradation operon negative regulatory protein
MSRIRRATAKRHRKIQARFSTVIYTLFGAYVVPRSGEVHVASLLKLVIPLGFSANAIRLGLSRMSKHGVFRVRRAGRCSYYSLSEKGLKWMEQGRVRAFEVEHKQWDGKWRLVVYNIPERQRALRDKLRVKLHSLGFAKLSTSLWIAPHDIRTEINEYLKDRGMVRYVETFVAEYTGVRHPREFAPLVWSIKDLAKKYAVFVDKCSSVYAAFKRAEKTGGESDLTECFAQRFCMTAEYVALRLEDPMLPLELLPENWVGLRAQKLHDTLLNILKPRADEFVDSVLAE